MLTRQHSLNNAVILFLAKFNAELNFLFISVSMDKMLFICSIIDDKHAQNDFMEISIELLRFADKLKFNDTIRFSLKVKVWILVHLVWCSFTNSSFNRKPKSEILINTYIYFIQTNTYLIKILQLAFSIGQCFRL